VVSPAGPVSEEDLKAGIHLLESEGFKVRLGRHVYERRDYLAGEDEARLSDFHDMVRDRSVNAIFCARGGYGTMRLLDRIHYDLIRENPKIILGYSDITALLAAVFAKTGLVTFHGPVLRDLWRGYKSNWTRMLSLLRSFRLPEVKLRRGKVYRPGRAEGPLLGGNLSLICHLLGTPFLPSLKGCVLFVEERGEPPYRIDRMLTHLHLSGRLKAISGFIAGEFDGCGDRAAIDRVLADSLRELAIPAAGGLPVGHGRSNMTLPLGLRAVLDTELMTLSFDALR